MPPLARLLSRNQYAPSATRILSLAECPRSSRNRRQNPTLEWVTAHLGALNSRAFWPAAAPTRQQTVLGGATEPRRSLAVVPLIQSEVLRRGSGQAPMTVWCRVGGKPAASKRGS